MDVSNNTLFGSTTASPQKKSKISFWSPEMAHDVIETPEFLWGSRTCDTIVAIAVAMLLIDYIYNMYFVKSVEIDSKQASRARTRTGSSVRGASSKLTLYI